MDNTHLAWPPVYSLKKHPRAKYIRFRASLRHGLEITVPVRFNIKRIPFILDQNRAWIEMKLREMLSLAQPDVARLPEQLEFRAFNSVWLLRYLAADSGWKLHFNPHQALTLIGNIQDVTACQEKLLAWIKQQAKIYLLPQLEQMSQETGLIYQQARIRAQTARWGSCSRTKTINLNYKLLFLPPELVRHVLIHELCHTVHFNHSDKFWALVAQFDPQWKKHRQAMKKAGNFVPLWL